MTRTKLPRPAFAAAGPDDGAPPEVAALAANLRARFAFWSGIQARNAMFEAGGMTLVGVPFAAVADAAGGLDGSGSLKVTAESMRRAAEAAARVEGLGSSGADVIAARVIRRAVEGLAPPKLQRAALARPSLAWRFPLANVADASPSVATKVAAYLDHAAVVRGDVEVPAHAGTAERIKLPRQHAFALYLPNEPPPDALVDATRCVPLACIVPAVSMREVLAALRASGDGEARAAADVIERHAAAETNPARDLRDAGLSTWGPYCVAAVLLTLREIRDAHMRHQAFAFPTTREANAAAIALAAGRKGVTRYEARNPATGKPSKRRALLRVQWEGKMLPVQLELALSGADVSGEALAAVLDHMADDGLRDWLALHALADAQGRTGDVRWSWSEHKRVAGYDRRIAAASGSGAERMTDSTARRAVIRRLWQFTRAALWEDFGNKLARRPIGDGPFVRLRAIGDLEGLEQERDDFTDAVLSINRALYRGAHRDARAEHRHFTGITPAVFSLRAGALRLAVFVLRAERVHRDHGLRVRFTEGELMRYARVRGDGKPAARHRADARAELARYVAAMVEAFGDGASMEPVEGEQGVYQWTPARWRVEREQLGAAPDRPALPPRDRPYTGAELRAWREARNLSQRDAAEALGVGVATVKRAELRPADPLPRSFSGAPWHVRALPSPPAELPAVEGVEGVEALPVEGGV